LYMSAMQFGPLRKAKEAKGLSSISYNA